MAILHLHSSWGPNAELYRKLLSSQNGIISNYLVKRTNLFGHIPSSFYGCLVYMYIYEPHSCGTTESISRQTSPRTGIAEDCEPSYGCWKPNTGVLNYWAIISLTPPSGLSSSLLRISHMPVVFTSFPPLPPPTELGWKSGWCPRK